ncbi:MULTISPECIES: cation diffusion facilitator family transporter [unclassified Herbaspirillum]|uniref:cation diffusion facilitator family transporter n=1 Tax=unclassified Herbaspirillum TaxID=2624150 RepID=UPI0011533B34|nr:MULTISPECIES: cation diffusion facilitator family transporter [unclassified Herbaspirillum]MBB5392485.1 cation diffusion facilitator family transporter [Herbaspirillum sp. SJZ102]TQK06124.1 cation diffusion facilitator family transporter [Herbaspirillum sp. SJZ130]TQK12398.1 cation diffusion facilitator family transporter [Herbaspirillum sp. SJZ106]
MLSAEKENAPDAEARYRAGRVSTMVSIVVNVGLTALQIAAGILSGSQALVADGVHSLSDLVSDFVVLFAAHHSRKEADADHQYGHQRYENAASLALGSLLLAVGIGMLVSAAHKIQDYGHTPPVHSAALWVALAALLAKELLFRYMLRVAERVRSGMLVANAWHARSDAASSLVVALGIGGSLLGFTLLDPVAAAVVGLLVVRMGWRFFWAALNDLMDRAVSEEQSQAIRRTLEGTPGVQGLHDLRTRKMGDLTLVDVHLEIDGALTVAQGHAIAALARQRVLDAHHVLDVMTHVDPVVVEAPPARAAS